MTNLNWRYATKKFNADIKLQEEQIQSLIEAIRLAPTSYGLQPFHVHIVKDKELLLSLTPASYGQAQIAGCSHLFVFSTINKIDNNYVDNFIANIAKVRNVTIENLDLYSKTIKGFLASMDEEKTKDWAQKQAYLAMGFLLNACADLQIDSCPMEGFVPSEYDSILNLDKQGLSSVVIVPIGIRSDEDQTQHAEKVRKQKADMFDFL